MTGTPIWDQEELAQRSGLTSRLVRHYRTCRLLPPALPGRSPRFSQVHLDRLLAIRELHADGIPLGLIRTWLEAGEDLEDFPAGLRAGRRAAGPRPEQQHLAGADRDQQEAGGPATLDLRELESGSLERALVGWADRHAPALLPELVLLGLASDETDPPRLLPRLRRSLELLLAHGVPTERCLAFLAVCVRASRHSVPVLAPHLDAEDVPAGRPVQELFGRLAGDCVAEPLRRARSRSGRDATG